MVVLTPLSRCQNTAPTSSGAPFIPLGSASFTAKTAIHSGAGVLAPRTLAAAEAAYFAAIARFLMVFSEVAPKAWALGQDPLGRADEQPLPLAPRRLLLIMASGPAGPLGHPSGNLSPRRESCGRDRPHPVVTRSGLDKTVLPFPPRHLPLFYFSTYLRVPFSRIYTCTTRFFFLSICFLVSFVFTLSSNVYPVAVVSSTMT